MIDSQGRTPATANVLAGAARTLIATTQRSGHEWRRAIEQQRGEVMLLPENHGRVALPSLLAALGDRGCLDLLVEGGGILLGAFFDEHLIDRVQAVVAPMIIGGVEAPVAVAGLGVARMVRSTSRGRECTQAGSRSAGRGQYTGTGA